LRPFASCSLDYFKCGAFSHPAGFVQIENEVVAESSWRGIIARLYPHIDERLTFRQLCAGAHRGPVVKWGFWLQLADGNQLDGVLREKLHA